MSRCLRPRSSVWASWIKSSRCGSASPPSSTISLRCWMVSILYSSTYISIEIKQWNNKQYAKRYNGTRALQIVNRRGKYTRTQEPTILKSINTSSLRPLTCVRFVVDSYDKRVWIQTDSNNFRIRQKSDSIEARKQDNENKSTRDSLHRCSTAAQQANFAIKRLHSTRLTADKQAANCRLES